VTGEDDAVFRVDLSCILYGVYKSFVCNFIVRIVESRVNTTLLAVIIIIIGFRRYANISEPISSIDGPSEDDNNRLQLIVNPNHGQDMISKNLLAEGISLIAAAALVVALIDLVNVVDGGRQLNHFA
jgi:hypothetical protein